MECSRPPLIPRRRQTGLSRLCRGGDRRGFFRGKNGDQVRVRRNYCEPRRFPAGPDRASSSEATIRLPEASVPDPQSERETAADERDAHSKEEWRSRSNKPHGSTLAWYEFGARQIGAGVPSSADSTLQLRLGTDRHLATTARS